MTRRDRAFITAWVMMGVAIILVLGSIFLRQILEAPLPPFEYTSEEFSARDPVVCPGEKLVVDITTISHVRKDPGIALVAWSILKSDSTAPVYRPSLKDALLFPTEILLEEQEITFPFQTAEIPDLPPGDYRYRHYAQLWSTRGDSFFVPFTIPDGCE